MTLIQALILGIVQGITEFLPISSSGHLIIFPHLLGWPVNGLQFDMALHLGTLLALLFYYWRLLLKYARNRGFIKFVAVSMVPAVALGLVLSDLEETVYRQPALVAINLIWFSLVMWGAELLIKRRGQESSDQPLDKLSMKDGLVVGLWQSLALIPGISRSGSVMTGAIFRGFSRRQAAEVSFLIGIPVIAASGVLSILEVVQSDARSAFEMGPWFVGGLSAALTGLLVIKYLLLFLQKNSLLPFIVYRIVLGLILLKLFI